MLGLAAQILTLPQLPLGLEQTACVYLHRPAGLQGLVGLQAAPVTVHQPGCGRHCVLEVHETVGVAVQVPGSWRQSPLFEQTVVPSFEQWPTTQSSFAMQTRPDARHVPSRPPMRQLLPLSQSTPTSAELENCPPGTPVIDPDVSRTMSMFALWIWRSMITSGLTRASATPASRMVRPTMPITMRAQLGPPRWPALLRRCLSTCRNIDSLDGFIEAPLDDALHLLQGRMKFLAA